MSQLKSIIWSRQCLLISLVFLITTMNADVHNDERFRKLIKNDLPKKVDFDYYLTKLEKTVDFCGRHKVYLDANIEFGLFLIDVNLKEILQQKWITPKTTNSRLERLLIKNNILAHYFHAMVRHEDPNEMAQVIKFTQLFYNTTTWPKPSDKFNDDLLKETKVYSPEKLEKMYGKWEAYSIYVFDLKKYRPSLEKTDECIESLASMPVHNLPYQPKCRIPDDCKEVVDNASQYGYGLLQRIFFMVIARFSRDCIVFSKKQDKFKTDTYCMMSFNEAEYIASNRFGVPDLMFQQIALCGLLGHAQFLQNYWLKSLLEYQTAEGCFTQKLATGEFNEDLLREGQNDTWRISNQAIIMNGQCDGHFTAVAAATLSNALRYIIETYY